jgi:hypothetical protein
LGNRAPVGWRAAMRREQLLRLVPGLVPVESADCGRFPGHRYVLSAVGGNQNHADEGDASTGRWFGIGGCRVLIVNILLINDFTQVNPYFLRALTNRVWKRNGQDFSYPDSIWQLMVARIDMIVEKYFENSPAVTVQFTGHSLGGALAALAAAKLAAFLRKDTEMLKKDTERFR